MKACAWRQFSVATRMC